MDAALIAGRVLVADSDPVARAGYGAILAQQFDVALAASGGDVLAACAEHIPDLILLDTHLPEIDGYEICRRLRRITAIPIIFTTLQQTLETYLAAYDAGGDDLVATPAERALLLGKVALAIGRGRAQTLPPVPPASRRGMAKGCVLSVEESGALRNFLRAGLTCRSHQMLAECLVTIVTSLGIECSVMMREDDRELMVSSLGEPSALERRILEYSSSLDHYIQFRHWLVVNCNRVSILVSRIPDDGETPEPACDVRHTIAILAEVAEVLYDNIDDDAAADVGKEHCDASQ